MNPDPLTNNNTWAQLTVTKIATETTVMAWPGLLYAPHSFERRNESKNMMLIYFNLCVVFSSLQEISESHKQLTDAFNQQAQRYTILHETIEPCLCKYVRK